MLSNFDLDDIAENYGYSLNSVLMKNELKTISPKDGFYIVNLESSTQGDGTHWMSMVLRGKQCFYLDPFGILPPSEIIDFCRRIPKSHLAYSEMEIQNISADTCGWFASGLLIYLHDNPNKDIYLAAGEYMRQYSYDTTENNAILKSYFRHLPKSRGFKLLNKLYSQK